jgi:hypothetical protein
MSKHQHYFSQVDDVPITNVSHQSAVNVFSSVNAIAILLVESGGERRALEVS